jgi:hypothetical protein
VVLDPAVAALLGSVIGGIIGVCGTVVTAIATTRREFRAFQRTQSQQSFDRICAAYEYALNVFFNLKQSGSPDRASYGKMFAEVSLYGSSQVKALLDDYLARSPEDQAKFDVQQLIRLMKEHLESLQGPWDDKRERESKRM